MITAAELHRAANAEGLRFDQAEKDYVIVWLLCGLSQPKLSPEGWAFKGGTCLRHCYYPGYRFSEDIDFTCPADPRSPEAARMVLDKVATWVNEASGIILGNRIPRTIPGDFQVEILVEYSRGGPRRQGLPSVRVHLTFDEPILTEMVPRPVRARFSDLSEFQVAAYSKREIVAEKMRALLQQQNKWPRPRDLYDLWYILCQSEERFDPVELRMLFIEKCRARQIEPDVASLVSEDLKAWNREAWGNQLGPMMKSLPDLDKVWGEWVATARGIFR